MLIIVAFEDVELGIVGKINFALSTVEDLFNSVSVLIDSPLFFVPQTVDTKFILLTRVMLRVALSD